MIFMATLKYPWEYGKPHWENKFFQNYYELLEKLSLSEEKFFDMMKVLVEYKIVDDTIED
jgi:hypothetical protein